jgi:hypothetical protein
MSSDVMLLCEKSLEELKQTLRANGLFFIEIEARTSSSEGLLTNGV